MTSLEVFVVALATLLGPIFAIQVQKFIERATEARNRKNYIFYTLMGTRATQLAPDHVSALNTIELVFRGRNERKVIDAWRQYSDHLNTPGDFTEAQMASWSDRRITLFTELLFEMSQCLGYKFDRVQLRRGVYYPKGLGENETTQRTIQNNLLKVLSGENPIAMNVVGFPISEEAVKLQLQLQKSLIDCIEGKGELHVTMKSRSEQALPDDR